MSHQYPHYPKQPMQASTYPMGVPQYSTSTGGFHDHQPRYGQGAWDQPAYSPGFDERLPQRPPVKKRIFSPRSWSKRTRIIVGSVTAVVLLIIIIVAAVEGVKSNSYPDYSRLSYNQVASFEPDDFFDNFQYWDTYDPSQGFVHYDNPIDAQNRNLTVSSSQSAILRVDNNPQTTNEITGRHSARVQSHQTFNNGLFLFDIKHTPYGCATWPAVWLSDTAHWPENGEIDVIEQVNQATTGVETTLHTSKGCTMNVKRKMTGKNLNSNCAGSDDPYANPGCGVQGIPSTFGATLNNDGGGVYALELRSAGIRMWFFPRASLPSDVSTAISSSTAAPDPSTWGEALADFPSTDCDIGTHFRNQSIIANIDLCGVWAGKVYNNPDQCPGTYKELVTSNPSAFNEAFWEFGRFKVYQADGA